MLSFNELMKLLEYTIFLHVCQLKDKNSEKTFSFLIRCFINLSWISRESTVQSKVKTYLNLITFFAWLTLIHSSDLSYKFVRSHWIHCLMHIIRLELPNFLYAVVLFSSSVGVSMTLPITDVLSCRSVSPTFILHFIRASRLFLRFTPSHFHMTI